MKIFMHKNNLIKWITTCIAMKLLTFKAYADTYRMGPYLDVGAGVWNLNTKLFGMNFSKTGAMGGVGFGYLWALTNYEKPVFAGIQIDGLVYVNNPKSFYGAELSGVIGKPITNDFAVYAKLGVDATGDNPRDAAVGPLVGLGLAYQATQSLRLAVEGNYTFMGFMTNSVNKPTAMVKLQYSFG